MAKRQMKISGTEEQTIKEVNDAAEAYVDARDTRMKHTEKEKDAKDALIEVMRKHGLTVYKDTDATPPLIVTLVEGAAKVKVTEAPDAGEGDADEGKE